MEIGLPPDGFEFEQARYEDVLYVGERLRMADRREIEAFGISSSSGAIQQWVERSVWALSLKQRDEASAIFGLGRSAEGQRLGCPWATDIIGLPWMVGTPAIDTFGVGFIRACRPVVARMLDDRRVLVNFVHAEHVKAQRWIGWLGFQFESPLVVPMTNAALIPFWMAKAGCEQWAAKYIAATRKLLAPRQASLQHAVAKAVSRSASRAKRNLRLGATLEN